MSWFIAAVGYSVVQFSEGLLLQSTICRSPSLFQTWGLFLESSYNFLGPKSCFMCAVFAFKIKVSIILKMIQWKYQLKKQNWPVCELGTLLLFNWFWLENFPSDPKSYQAFRETGPWPILYDWFTYTVRVTDHFWFAWLLYRSFENEKKTCKMLTCFPLELQLKSTKIPQWLHWIVHELLLKLVVDGSTMNSLSSMIVLVLVVLNRTAVDSDWCFDSLCGSLL